MTGLEALALANKDYVADLYRRWKADPRAVDDRWAIFFAGFDFAAEGADGFVAETAARPGGAVPGGEAAAPLLGVYDLVHSYRELGHLVAAINPLAPPPPGHPLLDPAMFGFHDGDLDRVVDWGGFLGGQRGPLRELIARLRTTYCGTIGVEYLHMADAEQRFWLQERMEPTLNQPALSREERSRILDELVWAEGFEQFLGARYPTAKRFSIEGAESLVCILYELVETGGTLGVEEMVIGMPHRGRLAVLATVLRKPYEMLLAEFEGSLLAREFQGDGDVKYHLGYSRDYTTRDGRRVHLSLSPNPSHLEWIDPVVEGIVRAKQCHLGDADHSRVVPVLLHGDAAFTGQGIVAETLGLSELAGYRTGGTIHVIVNNQIGFTTPPEALRFTRYASDVAKIIEAPVFHVNGDDPEAAVHVARLAMAFRQRFKKDVFIDLVCYRRHGHNELDDPTFTQPVMYRQIAAHPTTLALYRAKLTASGHYDAAEIDRRQAEFRELMADAQSYARDFMPRQPVFAFGGLWKGLGWAGEDWSAETRVGRDVLEEVARGLVRLPEGFRPHPKAMKLMEQRATMVIEGGPIDWGCAEALALGSLVLEGTPVRFTGQDVGRGTFSHRHAVLYDRETGARWVPLAQLRAGQARFEIVDSMLSEAGCLGFEFGVSLADPRTLVVWEAQFGDFANGAQVIIDQFVVSSESKWQRMSGLVMLLPHGYEGQGPEHSSARLERFLQLCAENNIQVCNLTTPAQYFHALRRQIHRRFRKPLVLMSPKSLLRHKLAVSRLEDFTAGQFAPVLDDPATAPGEHREGESIDRARVRRILLCSGKIFYTLLVARDERGADGVAIVRVEQLYPFPQEEIDRILAAYPPDAQVFWVQEEPANQGAWLFMSHTLQPVLGDRGLVYVGRRAAASPATGVFKVHLQEEADLVNRAFGRL